MVYSFSKMKQEMVSQKEGEMEFAVLSHLDDMRRVTLRTQKYGKSTFLYSLFIFLTKVFLNFLGIFMVQ